MHRRPITDFRGCDLWDLIVAGLYAATNGNPCDGCGSVRECTQLAGFESADKQQRHRKRMNPSHETNAQIATRLGVSKRQVAKMRKRGEL